MECRKRKSKNLSPTHWENTRVHSAWSRTTSTHRYTVTRSLSAAKLRSFSARSVRTWRSKSVQWNGTSIQNIVSTCHKIWVCNCFNCNKNVVAFPFRCYFVSVFREYTKKVYEYKFCLNAYVRHTDIYTWLYVVLTALFVYVH